MSILTEIFKKTMFRHYERGTWPYDIVVLVVLLATFIPPVFYESLRDTKSYVSQIHGETHHGIRMIAVDEGLIYIGLDPGRTEDASALDDAVAVYRKKNGTPNRIVNVRGTNGEIVGYFFVRDQRRLEEAE